MRGQSLSRRRRQHNAVHVRERVIVYAYVLEYAVARILDPQAYRSSH